MTNNEMKLGLLFDELVPVSGMAETMAGEIVRAGMRIGYRWRNDGDRIDRGYGKETCSPAARFLKSVCARTKVSVMVTNLSRANESDYEDMMDDFIGAVADYVNDNPELREVAAVNMWDY